MTDNNHPITPPPELVQLWLENYFGCWDDVNVTVADASSYIATQTSQWIHEQRGADIQKARDEELEACCEWLTTKAMTKPWETVPRPVLVTALVLELRAARRPKPPSLKEQALGLLNEGPVSDLLDHEVAVIRRALDALPD